MKGQTIQGRLVLLPVLLFTFAVNVIPVHAESDRMIVNLRGEEVVVYAIEGEEAKPQKDASHGGCPGPHHLSGSAHRKRVEGKPRPGCLRLGPGELEGHPAQCSRYRVGWRFGPHAARRPSSKRLARDRSCG